MRMCSTCSGLECRNTLIYGFRARCDDPSAESDREDVGSASGPASPILTEYGRRVGSLGPGLASKSADARSGCPANRSICARPRRHGTRLSGVPIRQGELCGSLTWVAAGEWVALRDGLPDRLDAIACRLVIAGSGQVTGVRWLACAGVVGGSGAGAGSGSGEELVHDLGAGGDDGA